MQSGNASGYHLESGLIIIKPSGVPYDQLAPEDLCVVGLDGTIAQAGAVPDGHQSRLRPSVDTGLHLAVYRADPGLGGVIHTHSTFATAWAAAGRSIPCAITAMADEFGGSIPCAPYADPNGSALAESLLSVRSVGPAVLAARHGLFTFDTSPMLALKAAVMAEDAAKTIFFATLLGPVTELAEEDVRRWWTRYHTVYGQEAERA
jgi:L-ribulose-5-phosphate 4-epimerase